MSSHYKKSKLPKQSRTIRLKGNKDRGTHSTTGGSGRDFRKWYRCWHCGFTCNEDRDSLGGISSGDGIEIVEFSVPDSNINAKVSLGSGALEHVFSVARKDSNEEVANIKYNFKPDVGAGCPFCGSLNWRGDYP